MKNIQIPWLILFIIFSQCEFKAKNEASVISSNKPKYQVFENGELVKFAKPSNMFETQVITKNPLNAEIQAPATVVASVLRPSNLNAENIILFEDPDLNELYTMLLQSIAHYARDKDFYERNQDMFKNGAATGREVTEAKTGLVEAATELAEKEAKFKMRGFDPNELRTAPAGIVWLIANVSEAAIGQIKPGQTCHLQFISFPGETYDGVISAIGEALDNATRTVKVRITLQNTKEKFKPGMFANVSFGLSEGNIIAVPQNAMITALGKQFIFKKDKEGYRRVEVKIGKQIGDKIIISEGLKEGDTVVIKNTMLLKGISLGY